MYNNCLLGFTGMVFLKIVKCSQWSFPRMKELFDCMNPFYLPFSGNEHSETATYFLAQVPIEGQG
jgi:hypothetical protein